MKFKVLGASMLLACASFAATAQTAESYPNRPVTLVVPYGAGGPIDVVMRKLGERLSEKWNVSVVIDNRPGGSEVVGAQRALGAPADGHTLFVGGAISMSINPMTFKELSYKPEDYAPVSRLISFNMAFVVPAETPAKNFDEFVKHAQDRNNLNFGCPGGIGGLTHLAYTDIVKSTKAPLDFIPYNGLSGIIQDMVGGRLDSALGGVAPLSSHIKEGKLKALAVGGSKRSKVLPDVPTFAELGYEDVSASFYSALLVKAGTPQDIIDKIARDTREILMDPAFAEQNLDPFAIDVIADTPEEFAAYLERDQAVQQERVKSAGIEPR